MNKNVNLVIFNMSKIAFCRFATLVVIVMLVILLLLGEICLTKIRINSDVNFFSNCLSCLRRRRGIVWVVFYKLSVQKNKSRDYSRLLCYLLYYRHLCRSTAQRSTGEPDLTAQRSALCVNARACLARRRERRLSAYRVRHR